MVAEFQSDLIRMRTREGLEVARAAGKLRGRKPKLSVSQERHLVQLHRAGEKNPAELAELFSEGRSTVYRALERGRLLAQRPRSADASVPSRFGDDAALDLVTFDTPVQRRPVERVDAIQLTGNATPS